MSDTIEGGLKIPNYSTFCCKCSQIRELEKVSLIIHQQGHASVGVNLFCPMHMLLNYIDN